MEFSDEMVKAAFDHFPLVALFALSAWWGFPLMFKKVLANGGGKQIAEIIRRENALQSEQHRTEMERIVERAINSHEAVEVAREKAAHQELLQEITDRYELAPKRRSRR